MKVNLQKAIDNNSASNNSISGYHLINNRALLLVQGEDSKNFLQGLLSNDVNKLDQGDFLYALMLTPQGKFLYDFFVFMNQDGIYLDVNKAKINEIKQKLNMYRLRSKVTISDVASAYEIWAVLGDKNGADIETIKNSVEILFTASDPRSKNLGQRLYCKKQEAESVLIETVSARQYSELGILNLIGSDKDMEGTLPLDFKMDEHGAIDYKKGCYVGQEVTARMHYRNASKKQPYILRADSSLEEYFNREIKVGDKIIGVVKSAVDGTALALLRVEDADSLMAEKNLEAVLLL